MNIKFGYISDCHLEFAKRLFYIPEKLDFLIFAGDTHRSPKNAQKVIKELRAETELPIIYICGNHEFYGRTFPNAYNEYKKILKKIPDVHFLEKDTIVINGVRILGTTLWSDISNPMNELYAKAAMNDYRYIYNSKNSKKCISPSDTTKAFLKNKKWIISILKENFDGPTIVVTHHLPTFQVVNPQYKNNPVTSAYASALDDILVAFAPDVWIYGHSHSGLSMRIGKTEVLTNPIGYPGENQFNDLMKFKEFNLVQKNKK
jgi:predicted phosphodiesterase